MSLELLGLIVAVIAGIVVPLALWLLTNRSERNRKLRSRIVNVKWVQDPKDPDVAVALRLFERRIPYQERDSPDDIVRWLYEVQDETKRGVCELKDFFLIARIGEDVAGFAYLQFYPAYSLAFFSYLVVEDRIPAKECHVSTKLLQEINKLLFNRNLNCEGVVVEVDEPEILKGHQKTKAEARIKRFQTLSRQLNFPLKNVLIPYFQPRLSVDDKLQQHPMRLMFAIPNPSSEPRRITKHETMEILRFLSEAIYGDHFAHRADFDQRYRSYLKSWYNSFASKIPEVVELY